MKYQITLSTLEQTQAIAAMVASCLPDVGVVTFSGNMGAGKTTFISKLIEALYINNNLPPPIITSPTFSLVHEYNINTKKIAHFDLFRIQNPDDVLNLGFDDYIDNALCFIEWAQNAEKYLENVILKCHLTVQNDERILTIDTFNGYSLNIEKFNIYEI